MHSNCFIMQDVIIQLVFATLIKVKRMAKMEAVCFLLHFETLIRQFASLSIMYTFLCVYFQEGNLEIQHIDFFSCASTPQKSKCKQIQTQNPKMFFVIFKSVQLQFIHAFRHWLFYIFIRVVIFESWSGWCYSVVLGLYSQLCLGHTLSCAWVIYSDVLGS